MYFQVAVLGIPYPCAHKRGMVAGVKGFNVVLMRGDDFGFVASLPDFRSGDTTGLGRLCTVYPDR